MLRFFSTHKKKKIKKAKFERRKNFPHSFMPPKKASERERKKREKKTFLIYSRDCHSRYNWWHYLASTQNWDVNFMLHWSTKIPNYKNIFTPLRGRKAAKKGKRKKKKNINRKCEGWWRFENVWNFYYENKERRKIFSLIQEHK